MKMNLEVLLLNWLARMRLVSYKKEMKKRFQEMFLTDTPMENVNWAVKQLLLTSRKDFFLIAKSFWDCDIQRELGTIKVPTLIITGKRDTLIPKRFSEAIHRKISSSSLVVIDECDHTILFDRPDEICKYTLRFLRSIKY